jgi:TonB family protein
MKRIKINTIGQNTIKVKLALIATIMAALAVIYSCQTEGFFESNHLTEMPAGWSTLKKIEATNEAIAELEKIRSNHPNVEFHLVKLASSSAGFANGNKYWSLNGISPISGRNHLIGFARLHPDGNSPMKDQRNVQMLSSRDDYYETIFLVVEEPPMPPGGMKEFFNYVSKEIRYPQEAKEQGLGGKVFVEFVIDKDGSVTDVSAVRGIGAGCDEEAVRVIADSPKWAPGKMLGEAVKVRVIMPINFLVK